MHTFPTELANYTSLGSKKPPQFTFNFPQQNPNPQRPGQVDNFNAPYMRNNICHPNFQDDVVSDFNIPKHIHFRAKNNQGERANQNIKENISLPGQMIQEKSPKSSPLPS